MKDELEKALVDISNSLAAALAKGQKDTKDEKKRSLKDVVCYISSQSILPTGHGMVVLGKIPVGVLPGGSWMVDSLIKQQ